ncbi:MAG: DUF4384 domain-containing protein [Myxococcales bacterium]|nr:DUF4384 domain-containing protein [Myxococcales bacterium]
MTPPDADALTPAEADAVEALLRGIEAGADAEVPAWVAQLGRSRLLAAVVAWPGVDLRGLAGLADPDGYCGPIDDHGWLAAAPADPARAKRWVAALRVRQAAQPELRAALVEADGVLGATRPLGVAPDGAAALFAQARGANRHGIFVDRAALKALGEPALPFGHGFRLAGGHRPPQRARWLAPLALAAAVLVGVGLASRGGPDQPDGAIYFTAGAGHTERAAPSPTLRSGDMLQVRVEGEAGHYVTLLLFGSDGQWTVPGPDLTNRRLTAQSPRVESRFVLDAQPGTERFVAVISAEPLPDVTALLAGLPRPAPAEAALRAAIAPHVSGAFRVVSTRDIAHAN